jgi:hypothetical protein
VSRSFRFHHWLLLVIVAIGGFLLLMPTKVQPVAWTPSPAPSLTEGLYADNQRLKGMERVGAADIDGPEALLLEDDALITGLHDGRVIRTSLDGKVTKMLTLPIPVAGRWAWHAIRTDCWSSPTRSKACCRWTRRAAWWR